MQLDYEHMAASHGHTWNARQTALAEIVKTLRSRERGRSLYAIVSTIHDKQLRSLQFVNLVQACARTASPNADGNGEGLLVPLKAKDLAQELEALLDPIAGGLSRLSRIREAIEQEKPRPDPLEIECWHLLAREYLSTLDLRDLEQPYQTTMCQLRERFYRLCQLGLFVVARIEALRPVAGHWSLNRHSPRPESETLDDLLSEASELQSQVFQVLKRAGEHLSAEGVWLPDTLRDHARTLSERVGAFQLAGTDKFDAETDHEAGEYLQPVGTLFKSMRLLSAVKHNGDDEFHERFEYFDMTRLLFEYGEFIHSCQCRGLPATFDVEQTTRRCTRLGSAMLAIADCLEHGLSGKEENGGGFGGTRSHSLDLEIHQTGVRPIKGSD